MVGMADTNGFLFIKEHKVRSVRERSWGSGENLCFIQERLVDGTGITQLHVTDFRLPGIFYLHYRWAHERILTFALRGWLLQGLTGLLLGMWLARRISEKPRIATVKIDRT